MTAPDASRPPWPPGRQRQQKPLTKRGRVVIWILAVFIAMVGIGLGSASIKNWSDSRSALAGGPVGTLVPDDRQCNKSSCTWIGEFTSADGTVTRSGVRLLDNEWVGRSDPMPARVDNVYLHDDPARPVAYPDDYVSWWQLPVGIAAIVLCPVIAFFVLRMAKRQAQRYPRA